MYNKILTMAMIASVAFGIGLNSYGAPLYIPKTDERSQNRKPLEIGQASFMKDSETCASLWIGANDKANPMIVSDPMTIRGYKTRALESYEYSVAYDSGISYTAASHEWRVTQYGITNRIVFTCLNRIEVADVQYDSINVLNIGDGGAGRIDYEINGNVVTFYLYKFSSSGTLAVSDVVLSTSLRGASFVDNDLNVLHFNMIDNMGSCELGKWREWCKHSNDGNLGVDWYKYASSGIVTFNPNTNDLKRAKTKRYSSSNYGIEFNGLGDTAGRYKIFTDVYSTNFCVKAGSFVPMEISFKGSDTNSLQFFSIKKDVNTDNVFIEVHFDSDSFDRNRLDILWTGSLANTNAIGEVAWTTLPKASYAIDGNKITIPNMASRAGFYKLLYDSVLSAECHVYMRSDIIIEDRLIIKGEDGKYWRIKCTGGTLSTEEVHL